MKLYSHQSGSSLLVAMLVMGILLTLTLGLSSLVVREIGQTSDAVASGRAYFAAEAGIEQALYDLSQSLPGYETSDWVPVEEEDIDYRYRINNKGDKIPYFPPDEPVFLTSDRGAVSPDFLYSDLPWETYNVLRLNETVTIPLFTQNEDGSFDDVEKFLVQYYVDFELDPEASSFIQDGSLKIEDFDIMRWKLFGNPKDASSDQALRTDAISDFYPGHSQDSWEQPVCIGSAETLLNEYNCLTPVAHNVVVNETGQATGVEDSPIPASAVWSHARECYANEAGVQVAPTDVHRGCSIQTFMETHSRNYITLTNVVNPDIVGISNIDLRAARANIYYRVVALPGPDEPKLVRDFADIQSDGYARNGEIRQSIDVKLRMSSFLPVFNFSLYRTDTEDEKDSPEGTGEEPFEFFPGFGTL